MNDLDEALGVVEARRKTLEVYAPDESNATDLADQFETRNVDVTFTGIPATLSPGFVVVRDSEDTFQGALGIDSLEAVVSPRTHPPWVLDDALDATTLYSFLQNTIFTAYDRRQMLAAAREIEERAWRVNRGALYVGFQRAEAAGDQLPVYRRFLRETNVALRLFVDENWDVSDAELAEIIEEDGDEIGRYWFVLFDGGGNRYDACGLLAEERDSGRYYGFWTYEPDFVADMIAYLRETY